MRAYLEIDLSKLKENFYEIKKHVNKPFIAVVKSNAYGHGLIPITNTLINLGVSSFFVATLEEAILLREHFPKISIILFEQSSNFKLLYQYKITLAVCSLSYLKKVISSRYRFPIHLKIETGFNRLGIEKEDIEKTISLLKKSPIILKGLYTHISSLKEYPNQLKEFKSIVSLFKDFPSLQIHMNSSYYLNNDNFSTHYRLGLALYGLLDDPKFNLQPLISLKSPIVRVKKVYKNELVGYQNLGVIKEDGYLYTIPLGYADGWVKGRLTLGYCNNIYFKQVGETCMDLMMLYSKNYLQENSIIELIGEHINIIDLALFYKESIYQIVSLLSSRLERRYLS